MEIKEILKIVQEKKLCFDEILLLYMIAHNDHSPQSELAKYMKICGPFSFEVLDKLVKNKYLENFNTPGESYPDMFLLTDKARKIFCDIEIAEELWKAYPATFFMKDKGVNFIARGGADKEYIMEEYLRRIDYSTNKHKFVLQQLMKYRRLVERGIVNGYKASDFVKMEIWNVVAEFNDEQPLMGRDL
jgi:DNA-binding MarR family transcriptional regulator